MHCGQAGQSATSSALALAIKDEAHSEAARPVPMHAGQAAAASSGPALAIKDEAHSDAARPAPRMRNRVVVVMISSPARPRTVAAKIMYPLGPRYFMKALGVRVRVAMEPLLAALLLRVLVALSAGCRLHACILCLIAQIAHTERLRVAEIHLARFPSNSSIQKVHSGFNAMDVESGYLFIMRFIVFMEMQRMFLSCAVHWD